MKHAKFKLYFLCGLCFALIQWIIYLLKKKKSYENGAAQILVKNLSTGCPYFTSTELLYHTQLKLDEMLSSLCYFWREK